VSRHDYLILRGDGSTAVTRHFPEAIPP